MVNSLLSLLATRQTSILSAASVIMVTVVLTKVLGLIRDRLLAHVFTPGTVGIFFDAFKLPDFIFQILILGALSVAFIPVFTEYLEDKGRIEAFKMAESVLILSLLILSVATIIAYILINPLTVLIAPGATEAQRVQIASLTRIILIGQIILVIGGFFIGILQSFQRFIIPALAGVMYNLGIILGIIFFSGPFGTLGPAIGVIIGASLHVLIQLPLVLSFGFRFRQVKRLLHPGVKEIIALMSVRTIGLAAEQINEVVGTSLASLTLIASLAPVTYLTFAQHLQVVPIGLFGATLAQAALPVLSAERARGRTEEFKSTLLTTMHQILFLSLPATAILIVIRIPVVRLIFGASQFDWKATVLTGETLAFLAIGLAAQSVSLLLVRGFYALKDTKTPVVISLVTVLFNITLGFYFVLGLHWEVWSIGLASSISALLSGVMLFTALHFKAGAFDLKLVTEPLLKMLMATVIMGVSLYIPIKLLDQVIFDTTRTFNLLVLTGLSAIFALTVYIIVVWFLKVKELSTFANLTKGVILKLSKMPNNIQSEELIHETDTV